MLLFVIESKNTQKSLYRKSSYKYKFVGDGWNTFTSSLRFVIHNKNLLRKKNPTVRCEK